MRDDSAVAGAAAAAVSAAGQCEKLLRPNCRASPGSHCMKPRPIVDKPGSPAFRHNFYSSSALDRLVEVALSPTDTDSQHLMSCKPSSVDNVATRGTGLPGRSTTPAIARSDGEGTMHKNIDSQCKKLRHCSSNTKAPKSPSSVQHTQSSGVNNFNSQQLIAMEAQKLKRLSNEVFQLRVHGDHHAKRFTPRFKSLLDICS